MRKIVSIAVGSLLLQGLVQAEDAKKEGLAAVDAGMAWLLDKQHEEGYWSTPTFPALTALPLWSLVKGDSKDQDAIDRAVKYLLSCAHQNGSIYREPAEKRKGGGLPNYNTALSMVALHEVGRPELVKVVQNARTYLAKSQLLETDSVYNGGMGYDPGTGRDYTDLSNSYIAFEAFRLTEGVEDLRKKGEARADLDWKAAAEFVQRVHNHPDFNKLSWVTDDKADQGGFAYHPDNTRATTSTNAEGVVKFQSFGSMTYAGMLSYIYANVDKSDPRVTSTFQWAVNHWSLDENVNSGQEGLFYYYNVLAKGMNAFGQDTIKTKSGKELVWRDEVVKKMTAIQKKDDTGGYWVNEVGRYMESNPILVTAYTLLALEYALGI